MYKIARINLSKQRGKIEKVDKRFAKKWIGGNGFGVNWLLKYNKKRIDPLSEKNTLIFATGPFTGTSIPTSGKCGVFSKSPQTNAFGESYSGGHFGAELRFSGLIGLIITGRANHPVYLWINDGHFKIREATYLWGSDTFETEKRMRKDTDKNASVAVIGLAGENLVPYACVQNEFGRQFGRTGMGTIMGSKNLKAIAVKGSQDIVVNNFDKVSAFVENWNSTIKKRGFDDVKYGTGGGFVEFLSKNGVLPTRNFQQGVFEGAKKLSNYYKMKNIKKNKACFACDKPCGKLFKGKDFVVEGPEYETTYSFGSNCGVSDPKIVAKAHYLADKYGLDAISTGATIAWAMECFEKKIISKQDVGFKIGFGDESFLKLIPMIAKKQGFGKTLSLGVKKTSQEIGRGSQAFAVETKGLEYPGYDVRGLKGLGLGFAVSPRGGCHLRSCFYAVDLTGGFKPLNLKNADRFSTNGKARMLVQMEDLLAVYDSLILCKFSRGLFSLEDIANLLTWVTEFDYKEIEVMRIGYEIMRKEIEFNKREGLTEKDNYLAKRMSEPSPKGKSKGSFISEKELEKMKQEYYEMRSI